MLGTCPHKLYFNFSAFVILIILRCIQVLETESRNVKALYRRAQAYVQLADLDLAELDIKKALEIDPNNR